MQKTFRIAFDLAQPQRPVLFIEHQRHAVVDLCHGAGRFNRDDAVGPFDSAIRRDIGLPQTGNRQRLSIAPADREALIRTPYSAPLIVFARGHDGARWRNASANIGNSVTVSARAWIGRGAVAGSSVSCGSSPQVSQSMWRAPV
jgi:hypothetical protein